MLSARNKPIQTIDDRAISDLMAYFKTEDHDIFVRYIKTLGVQRKDQASID